MMDLPPDVLALVRALGISPASHVRTVKLTQKGSMRGAPGQRFRPFRATETIATTEPAFDWRARMGPFAMIRVTDHLAERQASLSAKVSGLFPIVRPPGGVDSLRAQLIRYLAELR